MNDERYEKIIEELKKVNDNLLWANVRLRKNNIFLIVLIVLSVIGILLKFYLG